MNGVKIKGFEIRSDVNDIYEELSNHLSMTKVGLIRSILNRASKEIKAAAFKAGGMDKLDLSLTPVGFSK